MVNLTDNESQYTVYRTFIKYPVKFSVTYMLHLLTLLNISNHCVLITVFLSTLFHVFMCFAPLDGNASDRHEAYLAARAAAGLLGNPLNTVSFVFKSYIQLFAEFDDFYYLSIF